MRDEITFPCGHSIRWAGSTWRSMDRVISEHPNQNSFECPACGKPFTREDWARILA